MYDSVMGLMLWGALWVVAGMAVLWLLAWAIKEPSIVDVGWTLSVGGLAWYYYFSSGICGTRPVLLLTAVSLWTLRMLGLLLGRYMRGKKDKRYEALTAGWTQDTWKKYFIFFEAQALAAVVLSLPFAFVMTHTQGLELWDLAAILVFLAGFSGVAASDEALKLFQQNPENEGKVCTKGLWRYSRHPNYFFEIVLWIGFALFAISSPLGWLGLISPVLLLVSVFFVTGIPPTEKHLLQSKGEEYRLYQQRTSKFIPLPPGKNDEL